MLRPMVDYIPYEEPHDVSVIIVRKLFITPSVLRNAADIDSSMATGQSRRSEAYWRERQTIRSV
jgi:hypothetical protein